MIGSYQLVLSMIRLSAGHDCPVVVRVRREFIRVVHPGDARIDVLFVRCPDLQDFGHPAVRQFRHDLILSTLIDGFLSLDTFFVIYVGEIATVIFDIVYYA